MPDQVVPTQPTLGLTGELARYAAPLVAFEKRYGRRIAAGAVFALTHPDKVRDGTKAIFVAFMVMFGFQGCASLGTLTPAASASLGRFECEVRAFSPLLKDSARDVVEALEDGRVDPGEVIDAIKAETPEAKAAIVAFKACRSLPAVPQPKRAVAQ